MTLSLKGLLRTFKEPRTELARYAGYQITCVIQCTVSPVLVVVETWSSSYRQ